MTRVVYDNRMILLHLKDEEYPYREITNFRDVSRGIVVFPNGRVAIHLVHRDDRFGNQTYFETPGGGVDEGETFEVAVKRECEEELGYEVEVIECIAEINDFYNLIGRQNRNRYYLCKAKEYVGKHFESSGDSFIQETKFMTIEEAIDAYSSQEDHGVAGLVKRRELPVLLEAKRILEGK